MNELLTIKEAAEMVGCHESTIRNWIKSGVIESLKIGGKRRFKKSVIEKILTTGVEK